MKRLIIKGGMLGVILFGFSLYANYLYTGQLPSLPSDLFAKFSSSVSKQFQSLKSSANKATSSVQHAVTEGELGKVDGIYRWKGAEGGIHFGDEPPEGALELILMSNIDPNANVVTLPKPTWSVPASEPKPKPATEPQLHNPYSPEGVKELMDKALEARDLMNERTKKQQEILDKL